MQDELIQTINKQDLTMINNMIMNGVNVNFNDRSLLRDSPLHIACGIRNINIDIIATLIYNGKADVNNRNYSGNTPIIGAIRRNNITIVSLLINEGADVNNRNRSGWTPLHYAIMNIDIIKLLLKNNADATIKTIDNKTPLMMALHDKYNMIELDLYDLDTKLQEKYIIIIKLLIPATIKTIDDMDEYLLRYPDDENLLLYRRYLENPERIVERLTDFPMMDKRTIQTIMYIHELRDDTAISKIPYELLFDIMSYILQ